MTFKTMFKIGEKVILKDVQYKIDCVRIIVSATKKDIEYGLEGMELGHTTQGPSCWANENALRRST